MNLVSVFGSVAVAAALTLPTAWPGNAMLRKSIVGGATTETSSPVLAPVKDAYREMLTRPLFSASRRPAAGQGTNQSRPAGNLPVLRGVVITPNFRKAVLETATPQTHHWVLEGQRLEFGTIERIDPNRVTILIPDGTRADLWLKESNAASARDESQMPSRPQKPDDRTE